MSRPRKDKGGDPTKLMVVEGSDDQHVFYNILAKYKFSPEFEIEDEKGLSKLHKQVPERLIFGTALERLGIVVDADIDPRIRWKELRDILEPKGYSVPDDPDPEGTILDHHDLPRIGIWIMPDNVSPGSVEQFVIPFVPAGDQFWDRATRVVDEIPEDQRLFKPQHHHKTVLRTWLAWQREPGLPPGRAIGCDFLRPERHQVEVLLNWLTRLYA